MKPFKQKIFKLTAFALAVHSLGMAQQISKNTIVVNSGNGGFGPNVSAFNPGDESATDLGGIGTSFIQDIVIKDHYAYVAATDSIIKYDLANNTRVDGAEFGSTSTGSLLVHGDYLFVGNQFSPTAENLEVFDINTMDKIKGFSEITTEVPGMTVMGDTIYILQNIKHTEDAGWPGYYVDSLGYVSKISLDDLEYQGDIEFEAETTHNFSRIFANDGKLHIFGTHQQGTTSHHAYTHTPADQSNTSNEFPYSINFTYGSQARQLDNVLYFKFNGGIGSYDLDTETVIDEQIVDASVMAFDLDVINELFYVTSGDYASTAAGAIYNMDGENVGSFDVGQGYAPEAIAVDYNWLPNAVSDYSFVIQGESIEQDNRANDGDADQDILTHTFSIQTEPENGTVVPVFGDHLMYTADAGFAGVDEATYRLCDVYGDCSETTVYFEVTAPYDITVADFEEFSLETESYYNGSDSHGGFISGSTFFGNSYNAAWGSWSGFSYSNTTDTETEGFTNQYSAYAGGGAMETATYGVSNGVNNEIIVSSVDAKELKGLYITNATYTALSMKNGDAFAKQFGGESGNDPDSLIVRFTGIDAAGNETSTVDFYLADYTFEDNEEDYIVEDWVWVDLSSLGDVVSVNTTMISSDNGDWGMNTPAYFCVDKINYNNIGVEEQQLAAISLYPNPTSGVLQLELEDAFEGQLEVIDAACRVVWAQAWNGLRKQLDLSQLERGIYSLRLYNAEAQLSKKFLKY